jgi:D-lactate dehydrogenase
MKVIAFDVLEQKRLSEQMGFEYRSLEDLLKQSDIVSLHVPYLPSTKHLINQKTIHSFKKGAVLINTSRGGLIETGALVKALDEKILSAAALDVLEGEESQNYDLLQRENVIYTPHMAFYSREAVQRILDTTVENIRAFLEGKPRNTVSL